LSGVNSALDIPNRWVEKDLLQESVSKFQIAISSSIPPSETKTNL